ncbi:transglycosylase SLT domain-containing protein [Haliscomenobacter sp.]|uniref:lytic transglycosylase domain-containing protein n=1 Tax=Haliscomenobacter sp. TaxID=2717303 RepID=UPI0035944CF9
MLTLLLCFSLETQAKTVTNEIELDEAEITRRLHAMENRVVKPRYDPVVMSYLRTYLVKGREGTEQMLGRRFIYFPLFEDVLFQNDLPEELKALSIVESALHNRAISRVGAMGLWQFMPPTGRSLGLQVDANIDERRDTRRSTEAAAVYLKKLYKEFSDWELAIAAYNSGSGRVIRALKRGRGTNYWAIRGDLPKETANYVPAFIAASYLLEHFDKHGLTPKFPAEELLLTTSILVHQDLSFEQVAKLTGVSIETIDFLNPAFNRKSIPASARGYYLTMPSKVMEKVRVYLETNRPDGAVKPELITSMNAPKVRDVSAASALVEESHEVSTGETLEALAKMYGCTVDKIKEWNKLDSTAVAPGQFLKIFRAKNWKLRVERMETFSLIPMLQLGLLEQEAKIVAPSAKDLAPEQESFQYYVTTRPESIFEIADRFPGANLQDILKINELNSNRIIRAGTRLKIRKL